MFPADYRKLLRAKESARRVAEAAALSRLLPARGQLHQVPAGARGYATKAGPSRGKKVAAAAPSVQKAPAEPTVVEEPVKTGGFLLYGRADHAKKPAAARIKNFQEIWKGDDEKTVATQAARCMDCGVPTCTDNVQYGCPLGNKIPDWNELVHRGDWRGAFESLRSTNNFPEWTGRVCPAPCEGACVLGIIKDPVAIKSIEVTIADRAYSEGWMVRVA